MQSKDSGFDKHHSQSLEQERIEADCLLETTGYSWVNERRRFYQKEVDGTTTRREAGKKEKRHP